MAFRRWQELSSAAFAGLDPARTIAVLPLAATEQHGPHLPTGTDAFIAAGLMSEAAARAPAGLDVVELPMIAVGASLEHTSFPGTLSASAEDLARSIVAVAEGVSRTGLRKLVLVSGHGGNSPAMITAALRCRVELRLLVVTASFSRFGCPPGLIDERELAVGVHGGLVETALMLHLRPDLVALDRARDFPSLQTGLAQENELLRAYGPVGFGWLAEDLNPAGVVGDAAAATAEIGAAIATHRTHAFLQLLGEIAAADLAALLGRLPAHAGDASAGDDRQEDLWSRSV